jgi:hypothetical protein
VCRTQSPGQLVGASYLHHRVRIKCAESESRMCTMLVRLPLFSSSSSFLLTGFRKVNLLPFSGCKINSEFLSRSLNTNSTRGSVPLLQSTFHTALKFDRNARPLSTTVASANPNDSIKDETSKALHSALRTELKKELQHDPKPRTQFRDWTAAPADQFLGGDKSTILLSRRFNDEEICVITSTEVVVPMPLMAHTSTSHILTTGFAKRPG